VSDQVPLPVNSTDTALIPRHDPTGTAPRDTRGLHPSPREERRAT
jgi:hypothetical protein